MLSAHFRIIYNFIIMNFSTYINQEKKFNIRCEKYTFLEKKKLKIDIYG